MDENEKMLERQLGISRAFGNMYFAIYSVNLESGNYLEVSTLDVFKEHIPPHSEYPLLFDMVVTYYVSDGYKEIMRNFLNMQTIRGRLAKVNSVSMEFFGTTQGWCRASLVAEKRDAQGQVLRILYVTQEINEEIRNEQKRITELKRSYEAAESANRAKSDFLFRMSHDIRTPLNAIIGFDHLIADDADNAEKVREYAEKIRVSGNLLLSLLNEILNMTKLESGKVSLNTTFFRLGELLEEVCVVIAAHAAEKDQTFTVHRQAQMHDLFSGDRARISRVLLNILGNALKYTDVGGKIELSVCEEGSEHGEDVALIFTVTDNGIGMSPELTEHVFEKFRRGADSEANGIPGTGLGLPIAKSFVDLMGGTIRAESEQGKGSTFTVTVPLKLAQMHGMPEETELFSDDDILRGLRILVVEDNQMNMEIIIEILSMTGACCEPAFSGREALEKLRFFGTDAYDLIIMDVCMPEMDGYETTRRIRRLPGADAQVLPIIALTANAFADDVENAKKAGMNAHLAKPLDVKRLRQTIEEMFYDV